MELTITSIEESRANFNLISQRFLDAEAAQATTAGYGDDSVESLIAAMNQFFDIVEAVNLRRTDFVVNDISDIGEHGLSLLEKFMMKAESLQLVSEKNSLGQIALVIADWVIENDGTINLLEPIVDALAQAANAIQDKDQLIALAAFMGEIAEACSDTIKHDLEVANMHRPWRILNINRGIVATRTHDPETMHNVFANLINALPMDAPGFFKEGMSEMVRLNYPEHVRVVMQEYFDKTDMPQIH